MIEGMIIEREKQIPFENTFDRSMRLADRISCNDGIFPVFAMQIGHNYMENKKLYGCISNNSCHYLIKQNNLKICSYLSGK